MARDKFSPNSIPNINTDWGKDENDAFERPFSGAAVQNFIKAQLKDKVGCRYEDTDNDRYLFFASEEDRDLYLEDPEANANLLKWTADMQKAYTAEIYLSSPTVVSIKKGSQNNYIDFTFDIVNRQGASSGDSAVVTYTIVSDSGKSKTVTEIYNAGDNVHFNLDAHLSDGTNRIQIALKGKTTLASTTQSIVYNVIAFSFASEFDATKIYSAGEQFSFVVRAEGSGTKYFETEIDGEDFTSSDDYITALNGSKSKVVTIPQRFEAGKHIIKMRGYITVGNTKFYSDTIYKEFAVSGGEDALLMFSADMTDDAVRVKQYETITIGFSIYDPRNRNLQVVINEGTEKLVNRVMATGDSASFDYTPLEFGAKQITATLDGKTYTLEVDVEKSDVNVSKATAGLILELSAKGRSNSDTNREEWKYNQYSTTLRGVAFNAQSGWSEDALVLSGGATMEVDIAPLRDNIAPNGLTIELDYMVDNGNKDDSVVLWDMANANGVGIKMTPIGLAVQSSDGSMFNHLTMTGKRKKIAIIFNRNTIDSNKSIVHTMVDGKMGYALNYTASNPFACSKNIKIGDETGSSTIRIYGIRVYNRALTIEEEMGNYAIDSGNVMSFVSRNDICVSGSNRLSFDKTKLKVASMRIIGDVQKLLAVQDKTTTITATVEFYDPENLDRYWKATNVTIKNQGTSTLKFPVKNFSFNYKNSKFFDILGNEIEMKGIKLHELSAPVLKNVAKCDFMESSSSFNTAGAIAFNDVGYKTVVDGEFVMRSEAQKYAATHNINTDIRTAIDGIPVAMFYQQNERADEVCLGQYNLNNGKDDCPEAYGFKGLDGLDVSNTERWELAEEDGMCAFTAESFANFDSDYGKYFECVFPAEDHSPARLKRLCSWLAACENNQAKFDAEYEQYLEPYKLAHYYIHIFVKNIGVDQVAKNMHLFTEDGQHWWAGYYDGDSAKLNDNDGYQFDKAFDENGNEISPLYVDRQSTDKDGNYIFQAHNSVLWNCIEGSESFMAIIRKAIAAEYSAGLNYDNEVATYVTNHTAKFPERVINQNAEAKYFDSFRSGKANYLYVCQGIKDERMKLIADRRLKRFEALWGFGGYASRAINFRLITGNNVATKKIKVKAFADYWFAYSSNLNMVENGIRLSAGQEYQFVAGSHANGDILRIHATDQMSELDMSEIMEGLYSLEVGASYSAESATHLKKLVLGDGEHTNAVLTDIRELNKLTALEYLDVRGFSGITSIAQLPLLHTLLASGSSLAVFNPSDGSTYDEVSLPTTITDLVMNDCRVGTWSYTPTATLNNVSITGTSGINTQTLVSTWIDAIGSDDELLYRASLTLDGIDWRMNADTLFKIAKIRNLSLKGKITLSDTMTYDLYNQLIETFGETCFNTDAILFIDTEDTVLLSANKTEIKSGDGSSVEFSAIAVPNNGKAILFDLYNEDDQKLTPSGGVSVWKGASLDVHSGILTTVATSEDFIVKVVAYTSSTVKSAPLTISVAKTIYPTAVTVSGEDMFSTMVEHHYTMGIVPENATEGITNLEVEIEKVIVPLTDFVIGGSGNITSVGVFTFPIAFGPTNSNIKVNGVTAEASGLPSGVSVVNATKESFQVRVDTFPETPVTSVITLKADTEQGEMTATKNISLKIGVDSISINGVSEFQAKNGSGSSKYTFDYTPSNYTVPVELMSVTSSNSTIVVSEATKEGFTLSVKETTADVSGTITAKFMVDGVEKTQTKTVTAKYIEKLIPFIIMNTTGSAQTFGYKVVGGSSSLEVATMSGHVKGADDYENVEFSSIALTTTQQTVTLQPNESFLIQSREHVPSTSKYLQFAITTFAPEFDGDVLGTCGGKMVPYACYYMFNGCSALTTAPELPATTLADYCYYYMFGNCTSLTTAPELPATTLVQRCYQYMFQYCRKLTTAPELPATTLANYCYNNMFNGCTALTEAPELPATTLANECYSNMFNGCTALTEAPELPATTLATFCYSAMFYNCTGLTTAPELPATELAQNCYQYMFMSCNKLNYVKAMFTTTPSTSYTEYWLSGVANIGTFVKNSAATWDVSGVHGIPEGWTVETAAA